MTLSIKCLQYMFLRAPEFEPQHHTEMLDCNTSTGQAQAGGTPELTGQSGA